MPDEQLSETGMASRCKAMTRSGRRCRNHPMLGSDVCWVHRRAAQPKVEPTSAEDEWLVIEDRAAATLSRAGAGNGTLEILDRTRAGLESLPLMDEGNGLVVDDRLTRARQLEPSQVSLRSLPDLLGRLLGPLASTAGLRGIARDLLDPEVLQSVWTVVDYLDRWESLERRLQGNYEVDDYGLDEGFLAAVMPLVQFLYRHYWRVEVSGIEHVPTEGRAMLVSNHSGVLPFDGAMIAAAVYNETESQRLVRSLAASWFPTLPLVSILLQKTGQVQASPHNAQRLLEKEELVAVFPEGYKGVGKLYRDRYQLARFGRGGFIRIAVRTGAPIIPVAVVGAEEIYPMIGRADLVARALGFPYFPVTPTWPWTGPFGLIPLPSKWFIDFGEPIEMEAFGPRAAANPALISRLTERVRTTVQRMLLERLARRRSVFFG